MALTLTISIILVLLVLTLIGAWRGVLPGLLTLIGTMMGALLAQLWAPTWGSWLAQRFQIERPATLLWSVTALTFLLCVLLIGYASALLLPQPKLSATAIRPKAGGRSNLLARATGALLGLFEATLLLGFLLRYSVELLKSDGFNAAVRASLPARLLHDGLGWAFLAPALLVAAALFVRLLVIAARRIAARRRVAAQPPMAEAAAAPPAEPRAKA